MDCICRIDNSLIFYIDNCRILSYYISLLFILPFILSSYFFIFINFTVNCLLSSVIVRIGNQAIFDKYVNI